MSEKRAPTHPDLLSAYQALERERQKENGDGHGDPLTDGNPAQIQTVEGGRPGSDGATEELVLALQEAKETIALLNGKLDELLAQPKVYGRVVTSNNVVNPSVFALNDIAWVVDKDNPNYQKVGKFIQPINEEEGTVVLEFADGSQDVFDVGLPDKPKAQVKLLGKDDGTFAVVVIGDTQYEVGGLPGWELQKGSQVKVNMQTKQIYDVSDIVEGGIVASVVNYDTDSPFLEIEIDGRKKEVHAGEVPAEDKPEEGDRVILDQAGQIVIRYLPREQDRRFTIDESSNVTWNDVGGLEEAKEAIKEAVELPFQFPDIFKHYHKAPPKGVLLYGPPGCGKTLVGKATTSSLANIYGKKAITSGFIYVKGPEILNMYVGNSEKNIREMFARGRRHYEKYGFPAVLFLDEAEAVLSERGTGRSSDVDKTIVPMFLSEMDGLVENHILVMLATNRPKMLDPAVVREGRVDRHIKVPRPTLETAPAIFEIHLRNIPIVGMNSAEVAKRATADMFNNRRKMYQVKQGEFQGFFTFGDCVTGSMIAGVVDQATSIALKRDLNNSTLTGITPEDVKNAIENIFRHHATLNHKFDLEDYYERHGLQEDACEVAKVQVKAA